ncbi:MAG: c-type cytochrome [Pirellulales bacterium]|nr:c-type cytochrome [Pirellulales bacterium]
MSRLHLAALAAIVFAALLASGAIAQIQLATDAPKPLSPEESLKHFRLPDGFHMELVAAEPHIADPVAMAFDAKGRLFVCEIHGYNLEGYLDVLELNKTGQLDTAVRRIPANEKACKMAEQEQYGTVKLLEDSNGDGQIDRDTVWADRLPPAYGVVPARDGVIVLCAPDILYLADRDGDGLADTREVLFTGFGAYDMWSRINNPRWGVDNWIYAVGAIQSGGTIRGPHMPGEVHIGAVCFRFKPDGSRLEPCSGNTSGFGQALDDWGDRFLVTNQQHALFVAPLPHRYLARNPHYAAPSPVVNISTYGHPAPVYPISRPDPWRLARSKDPAWVKFYGEAEATANGFFTAASGQVIYTADAFAPEFRGNHFSVDNAQNLVHRCLLEPDGLSYQVRRPRADERTEFLLSDEQWFRPVNLVVGPDAALYVVDMYRDIIEDYSAIPRFLQQLYVESIIAGSDKGRIWRVVAGGSPRQPRFNLAACSSAQLVGELSRRNAWWRETAQRLLVERGDRSVVPVLESLAREGATPQMRLHAIYTIEGLGALTPETVQRVLRDPHFALRMHALALAEPWLDKRAALAEQVLGMTGDEHPRVRLQLAFTLGELDDQRAAAALAQLASRDGEHPWMQAAILSSVAESAARLAAEILGRKEDVGQSFALLRPLGSIVGSRRDQPEIASLLAALADIQDENLADAQASCLDGLTQAVKQGKMETLASVDGQKALRRLLVHPSVKVRQSAVLAAGLLKLQDSPEMKNAVASAKEIALDGSRPNADRQAAIGLLTIAPYEELVSTAEELLDARQPLDVQLAAVAALASSDNPGVSEVLLAAWPSHTPKVQAAVIEAIFSRKNRLPGLLDAIAAGLVQPAALDANRRTQLLKDGGDEIRRRAEKLLASTTREDRRQVLARYQSALAGPRDPARGKTVHQEQCAKCHKLGDSGFVVGPDLSVIKSKTDEMLLSDVLDPSNLLTAGYQNYTVITEDGRIFTGVLAAETATSVTLRKEEGVEQTILRKDIDEMAASAISMMPEDLDRQVTPQNVVDLIAYLREAFGPPLPAVVTLFDDDSAFTAVLGEGQGTATIDPEHPHSGAISLAITPPQRYALRVPGWEYPIRENPVPGEYRYLRFAWKCRGGDGVMIELAGGGNWPPADKPVWRYYSGRNTTGWAAVEVSPRQPGDWVVITRDLWKDFGDFTLTGIAPTAMGGKVWFDKIELLRSAEP